MEAFDVVVVGAGPAGSVAARVAAERGARTLLVDQRPELGHPVQCGEFLPTPEELSDLFPVQRLLQDAYRIPPSTILNETRWMDVVGPRGFRERLPLHGYTVARRAFDKALALEAQGAGAELRYPLGVTAVRNEEVHFASSTPVRARVVIGADGPLSTVARSAGLTPPRTLYRMMTARASGESSDSISLHFGQVAPGGYAWSFPHGDDLNVGIGVTHLPPGQSLSSSLDRFLRASDLGAPRDRTPWWVPIGAPAQPAVRGRILIAGDAANLVMATNGGGIPTAMISGRHAGFVAAEHVRNSLRLETYQSLLERDLLPPLRRGHRIWRLSERIARSDRLLRWGMRYIGAPGLDSMMRLRWPWGLGGTG